MDELINKDNYDTLLNAFAKEYRKLHKNMPLEITIVGGGSILINYGFREMTHDFDIATNMPRALNDVIINVANKYGLPSDWMNEDQLEEIYNQTVYKSGVIKEETLKQAEGLNRDQVKELATKIEKEF